MNNFERGDRALAAMEAYRVAGGFSEAEGLLGISKTKMLGLDVEFMKGYPFGDLIADLCHLMRRHDIAVDEMVSHGIEHFGADVIEQAWENNEEWDSELQNEDNEERAIEVMNAAGVPEAFQDAALKKVGLRPYEEKEED